MEVVEPYSAFGKCGGIFNVLEEFAAMEFVEPYSFRRDTGPGVSDLPSPLTRPVTLSPLYGQDSGLGAKFRLRGHDSGLSSADVMPTPRRSFLQDLHFSISNSADMLVSSSTEVMPVRPVIFSY
ncbi:hypothetical protein Bbelb_097810 [Branchiostoma belcheri]|nr:hypothetical protein Bbelb_097810 [Branchiostoma belcheri]